MPTKSKAATEPADTVEPIEETTSEGGELYATADEMATVLETLAELSERVDTIERRQSMPPGQARTDVPRDARQAAAMRDDRVFRAQVGRGDRRRESEGERQDKIVRENAERHLHEPAGDGVVTGDLTARARDRGGFDPGEDGMEDPASPKFESEGGMDQLDESDGSHTHITTEDTAALNH